MTIADRILNHVKSLPENAQAEVLDFVSYLESKRERDRAEYAEWSTLSLSHAMREIEAEPELYSLADIKEKP